MHKLIRIISSLTILILFIISFLSVEKIFLNIGKFLSSIQFIPSIISSINGNLLSIIAFITVIILTIIFGRIYCSFICPLGIIQDFFILISKKMKIKKTGFIKPNNIIKFLILSLLIISFILRNMLIVNLIDPYSIFGKIISDILNPLIFLINNFIVFFLEKFKIYNIPHIQIHSINLYLIITSIVSLLLIFCLSIFMGRFYCNQICPVGTILGFISKISIFKINLQKEKCNNCSLCEKQCRANCIDYKNGFIDQENCIRCFDCLKICPVNSINFTILKHQNKIDLSRRNFLSNSFNYITGFILISFIPIRLILKKINPDLTAKINNIPVIPPGALSIKHFSQSCISCYLCIDKCPTRIIKSSTFAYGLNGIAQPTLDYTIGYCQYECNTCSQVCPTNAITPISLDEKKTIQLGKVNFIKEKCIVVVNKKDCGACSEHCPTKAVTMVPYIDKLLIPQTNENICIGCGACQYACPVRPDRAIHVNPNQIHQKAQKPEIKNIEKKPTKNEDNDFPF